MIKLMVVAAMLVTCAASTLAQDNGVRQPNFPRVVTNPTGKNGYEELVMATDAIWMQRDIFELLTDSESFAALNLAEKRRLLNRPEVQKCLTLFQQGVRKPISTPHAAIDETAIFPEFSGMRNIARLLTLKMYVEMADGKVLTALDTLADGLKMGYSIQSDVLIGGLIGVAIDTVLVKRTSQHLGQFAVKDCDKILQIARDWNVRASGAGLTSPMGTGSPGRRARGPGTCHRQSPHGR